MAAYIARRLGQGALSLFAMSVLVFLSARLSGDPAKILLSPDATSEADYQRLRHALGLDRPLIEQYWIFITNALHGNLGESFVYHKPVSGLLIERLPATISLALVALVVSLTLGVLLGVATALRPKSATDRVVSATATIGMSAPQFWIAVLLIMVFAGTLQWLPAYGNYSLSSYVLPVATLSLFLTAIFMRLVRSSMMDSMSSDYVAFARLKGLSRRTVVWRHALKNSLIPVMTFAGVTLGALLNGSIVVETVFSWPGIGRLTIGAVTSRDYPLLQGAVLLTGTFYILAALLIDVLYAVVDPRIQTR